MRAPGLDVVDLPFLLHALAESDQVHAGLFDEFPEGVGCDREAVDWFGGELELRFGFGSEQGAGGRKSEEFATFDTRSLTVAARNGYGERYLRRHLRFYGVAQLLAVPCQAFAALPVRQVR